jgi:hypothetical protein
VHLLALLLRDHRLNGLHGAAHVEIDAEGDVDLLPRRVLQHFRPPAESQLAVHGNPAAHVQALVRERAERDLVALGAEGARAGRRVELRAVVEVEVSAAVVLVAPAVADAPVALDVPADPHLVREVVREVDLLLPGKLCEAATTQRHHEAEKGVPQN